MSILVGVDIGGSGMRLGVETDGVRAVPRSGAGVRILGTGIDVPALLDSAQALLADGGTPQPDAVVWSMRGLLGLADPTEVLAEVAGRLGARHTVVCSDAVSSLVGALGEVAPGAVVAAGTGAVAFGTDFCDTWHRVDGWGHLLGDRGSGAWIGLAALRSALAARDGIDDAGAALLAAATRRYGPVEGWPRQVMTRPDAPRLLAELVPDVVALAAPAPAAPTAADRRPDAAALTICREAGAHLGRSLLAASVGVVGSRLVATGGLLAALPVRLALEATLEAAGQRLSPTRGTSLDGALILAAAGSADIIVARPPYLQHR